MFGWSKTTSASSDCRQLIDGADAVRAKKPGAAKESYKRAIDRLNSEVGRKGLSDADRELRARANAGLCLVAITESDVAAVKNYFALADNDQKSAAVAVLPQVATFLRSMDDRSDSAIHLYVRCLGLPRQSLDEKLATDLIELLEDHCRIDESTPLKTRDAKLEANRALALLPRKAPSLVVVDGADQWTQVSLNDVTRIGRGSHNELVLQSDSVSQRHAVLKWNGGSLVLEDLKSRNGTCVRGTPITGPTAVEDGTSFQCGNVTLSVHLYPCAAGGRVNWALRNLGCGHFLSGAYAPAERAYLRLLELTPGDATVRAALGGVRKAMGRLSAAISDLAAVSAANPENRRARLDGAAALLDALEQGMESGDAEARQRRLKAATEELRQLAATDSKDAETFYCLARAQAMLHETAPAMESIQKAIALNTRVFDYYLLFARLAAQLGHAAVAAKALERALKLKPTDLASNALYGNLCYELGDYAQCAKRLAWVETAEQRGGSLRHSGSDEFRFRLGRSLFETGKYVQASRILAGCGGRRRDAIYYGGRCHARSARFDSAARIYYHVLKEQEDPEVRFHLASAMGNLQRFEQGLQIIDATEVPKTLPLRDARQWRCRHMALGARLLMRMNRLDEAAGRLDLAAQMDDRNEDVRFELGRLDCIAGRFDEAIEHFRGALAHTPDSRLNRLWLGRALFAQGKHTEAEEQFKAVLVAGGSQDDALGADAHFHLGRIRRAAGAAAKAISHLESARQLGMDSDALAFDLAWAYAEQRQWPKALAELSSLQLRHAGDPEITANLAAVSCRMAQDHLANKRYSDAVPLLKQAVEHFGKLNMEAQRAEAQDNLAEAYFRIGAGHLAAQPPRLDEAVAALQASSTLHEGRADVTYILASACFMKGDHAKACPLFRALHAEEPDNSDIARSLALCEEQLGHKDQAEAIWRKLATQEGATEEQRLQSGLGLAGFFARTQRPAEAGTLLRKMLDDNPSLRRHALYEPVARLAASYLLLAGRADQAEAVIQKHLAGASPGAATILLGTVLAKQGRYEESVPHLRQALKQSPGDKAIRALFEQACRAAAARCAMDGRFEQAGKLLDELRAAVPTIDSPTQQLINSVQATLLVSGVGAAVTEQAVAQYEKASKAQKDNPAVLRNYAILCHRLAIQFEQSGARLKADPYWKRGAEAWTDLLSRKQAFWTPILDQYNQGRDRRSHLKMEEVNAALDQLRGRLMGLHEAYGLLSLRSGFDLDGVRRHLRYAKAYRNGNQSQEGLAKRFLEECLRAGRTDKLSIAHVALLIADELTPISKDDCTVVRGGLLEGAVESYWVNNIADGNRFLKAYGRFDDSADGKKLVRTLTETMSSYLEDAISSARVTVGLLPAALPDSQKKLLFFQLITNSLMALEQLPTYQRSAARARLTEVMLQMLVQLAAAKR